MPNAIALSSSSSLVLCKDNIAVIEESGVVNCPGIGALTSF
jgi:hypothetical protein